MTRLDHKSEMTSRKAMIAARFTLADAESFCGVVSRGDPARAHVPCPACRCNGAAMLKPRVHGPFRQPAEDMRQATSLRCGNCGFDGDAISYVMAAKGWSSLPRTLDAAESFLAARPANLSGSRRAAS